MPEKQGLPPQFQDFRNFLFIAWRHLNLPDPTPVQYDLADYLQTGPRRKVIEAFRGEGKSYITSTYICWRLLLDPQKNFLVVSASKDRSDAFSTFTKRLINEMPILEHLKPREGCRDSNIAFDVAPARASHAPSVKSVGITGQLTGSRADEIVADDVESLNNSMTQLMRDRLAETIKEFEAILKPGGTITFLGTPQTEMSIYNFMPDRGYDVRVWPARIPEDTEKYQGRLAPLISQMIEQGAEPRSPVDPQRFNDKDLQEREASYGRSGFSLQFMLDTTLADQSRYPLKAADLMVTGLSPEMAPVKLAWGSSPELIINRLPNTALTGDHLHRPMWHSDDFAAYQGSVMFIDPSGRGKDETAYSVVKQLHGTLFWTDVGAFRDGYADETMYGLAEAAKANSVNYILIEENFGDGMFASLMKPFLRKVYPCTLEEVRSTGQKELRIIDTLEPVLNQHRLVVDEKVIQKDYDTCSQPMYSALWQLTRVTRARGSIAHDDRLESLSGAVRYWVNQMAADQDEQAENYRSDMLRWELDKFVDGAIKSGGKKASSYNWMSGA